MLMVKSEANKDEDEPTDEELQKRYEQMYRSMGPTVPTAPDGIDSGDEDEASDESDGDGEEDPEPAVEVICAECGHGSGAYPDDALDEFTQNLDGETVHYGCK